MNGKQITSLTSLPALPSAWEFLRRAISFYRWHWKIITGIAAIPVLLALPQLFIGEWGAPLIFLLTALVALVGFLSRLALLSAVVENGEPQGGVRGAFENGVKLFMPFAWMGALSSLAAVGGFFLLIIPGVVISTWISLASYTLFAEDRRGIYALTRSWYYVQGYWWKVFRLFLFFSIAVGLASLIVGFVATGPTLLAILQTGVPKSEIPRWGTLLTLLFNNLLLMPLGIIYPYGIYRALQEAKAPFPPSAEEEERRKKFLFTFIIIGGVGAIILIAIGGYFLAQLLEKLLSSAGTNAAFSLSFPPLISLSLASILDALPVIK